MTLVVFAVVMFVATVAWADHGVGLREPGMNPMLAALLWAGAAFVVGVAVVAIVTVLSRRRPSPPSES